MVLNTGYQYWQFHTKQSKEALKKQIADFSIKFWLPCSEMTKNCQKRRITQSLFIHFFVWVWYILDASWWILMSKQFRLCVAKGGRWCLRPSYRRPIFLLTDLIWSHSPNFGQPKQGQKLFKIFFRNPECVRITWVLAPKTFPVENFRARSDLRKTSAFHWFPCPYPKKSIGLVYPQFWCH